MIGSRIVKIQASAGSGKTRALSQRYIKLLSIYSCNDPSNIGRIVAITFTNKAAAEMKERILFLLKRAALGDDLEVDLERPDYWVDSIINNYSLFQVRTIDSLLFTILRALSFELDIAEDLEVIFDKRYVFDLAFDRFLADWERHRDIWKHLLKNYLEVDEGSGFYPEFGLRRRLYELFEKVGFRKVEPVQFQTETLRRLEREYKAALEEFRGLCVDYYKRGYLNKRLTKSIFEKGPSIEKALTLSVFRSDISLSEILTNKGKRELSSEDEKVIGRAYSKLRSVIDAYRNALVERCYARVGGYAEAVSRVAEIFYGIVKEQGLAVGEHWIEMVGERLKDKDIVPLVYAHFGLEFDHFLFDEFQDTSRLQWETMKPIMEEILSRGGSLFLVGDKKQAIYGWRGGDWRLMDEVDKGMFPSVSALEVEKRELTKNFRSCKELVEFFNSTFSLLEDREAVASLSEGVCRHKEVRDGFVDELVAIFSGARQEVHREDEGFYSIEYFEGKRDEMEEAVKGRLVELVEKEWSRDRDSMRSIAVLVRRRDEAQLVSEWLLVKGIPVVTESSVRLESSSVVKGLVSLLKYIHTGEELFLYGFLASGLFPYSGRFICETDLFSLWRLKKGELKREVDGFVNTLKERVSAGSSYELVVSSIELLGLEERLSDQGDLGYEAPFVERFLELIYLFEVKEGASLSGLVRYLDEGGLEEQVGLPDRVDAVQVMTIHKSKGLQFDVVFVPFTNWDVPFHERSPIVFHNGRLVQLDKNAKYSEELSLLKERRYSQILLEHLNLFYVALTRARDRLYLFLTIPERGVLPLSRFVRDLFEKVKN